MKVPAPTAAFEYVANPAPGRCPVKWCRKQKAPKQKHCNRHATQAWRMRYPIKAAWKTLRDNAKRRRKFFDLTLEQFTEFVENTAYIDGKGRTRHCLHIDRIDPARGYTFDNIQTLTCSENTVKGNEERNPF